MPHLVTELELPIAPADRAPLRFAVGADDTLFLQLPGGGFILHASSDGRMGSVAGLLAADAPLVFVAGAGEVVATSLDGKVLYPAVERVTGPGPWERTPAGTGCCSFAEHTLWRADPGKLEGGLLRVVAPPSGAWSVLDFHVPGAIEPRWRVNLTEGKRFAVAAVVASGAAQVLVVAVDAQGAAELQARASADGKLLWTVQLEGAAAEWRAGAGRLALSRDGARAAVLVESRQRCATCVAIQLVDARRGALERRLELEPPVAPRFSTLGVSDHEVWLFEHVPPKTSDLSSRPERCSYVAFDAARGTRRPAPASDWHLGDCTLWGLAQHPTRAGVVGLSWRGGKLGWLSSDAAP